MTEKSKVRVLEQIEPKEVFYYFETLTKIPRGSGNEKEVSEYLISFAKEHNFTYHIDKARNVLIKKPSSPGYENKPTVILQAHMDMVCEKNAGIQHDFEKDPIQIEVEDDKVIAKNTTLGADDGMGIAFALALLADQTAEHPALELVCTTDEERGMTGVEAFDANLLTGKILINLDSDDEGVFVIGCAGGPVVRTEIPIQRTSVPENCLFLNIKIKGLKGGHSGEDIHRGRAHSNQLLLRVLCDLEEQIPLHVADISGGLMYNAIPRESESTICITKKDYPKAIEILESYQQIFSKEYRFTDPDILIASSLLSCPPASVLDEDSKQRLLHYLYFTTSGIVRRNPEFPEIVESSVSLGVIRLEEEKAVIQTMTRSSVESMYQEMYHHIDRLSKFVGGTTFIMSNCPEWEYNPDSRIKKIFAEVYQTMFQKEPRFLILHAGLECGVISKKLNGTLDMIAAGPDIRNLHSPGEYVTISSTIRFWKFFKEVLKHL